MISYNNSDIVQCLRQYEMFANSLKLIKTIQEKEMIIKQLTKLEKKIIDLTNEVYEEEYYALANKKCGLLEEEKNRVTMLIDLINQRLSYVEKRCNDHYQLTGESVDAAAVLGANELDELEDRIKIIDKYIKNIKMSKELDEDIKSLSSKISLASEKIDINKSLNLELENTFKKVLSEAFEKFRMYDLLDLREEIEYAYSETEKSLRLAEENYEIARTSPANILADCEQMLKDIREDYDKYKEQICTLKLLELYNVEVNNYDELLNKRKEVNEIIKYIRNRDFLAMTMDTITKQYNTILMEQQDINTFNDLVLEKDRKLEALSEIEEENNSEEFQNVLKELIENERKHQEKIAEEQRKIEEEEKKKRLEIERKRQEEILKRQKVIEEARKKEIEKRTKQLLEEQQKSVLQHRKKEQNVSFETIKDISSYEEDKNESKEDIQTNDDKTAYRFNLNEIKNDDSKDDIEEVPIFKNKVDIEKELFDEFNEKQDDNKKVSDDIFDSINDKINENKFPDMSIDEYMKSFDEEKITKTSSLFDEEDFPSIPM